jgi:DNA-binding transcriptional ArsR family regulator
MSPDEAGPGQASAGAGQADAASERTAADSPSRDLRQVTDAQTMRALAHPVRIALLEALGLQGAMTATEVGELVGESPTTCSFHLRQLAKYGFVEEAGGGKGRARPWRMSSSGLRLAGAHDDPETELAAGALVRMIRDRQLDRYRAWRETKASYPQEWRKAADDSEFLLFLTAAELTQLGDEISDLLLSYQYPDRRTDPSRRPAGALPVELMVMSYPISLPGGPRPSDTSRPAANQAAANQEGEPA